MWNPEKQRERMKPAVDKVISFFQKKGISFSTQDESLENVIFTRLDSGASFKISYHSFYRYSGIACIYKEKGENQIEAIPVTDDMYMNHIIKPSIEINLKIV